MFFHLKESALFTFKAAVTFFKFFLFGLVTLFGWLRGFPLIDKWFYAFLLPKALIVLIGSLVTPIPLWLLILFSFLPVRIIAPLFFIAFILAFAHF